MPIQWRPTMSVGNEWIDGDHQQLIFLINTAEMALGPDGDRIALDEALQRLDAYTQEHFAREEQIMKAVCYPRYVEHRASHRSLVERLAALSLQIRASKAGTPSAEEVDQLVGLLRSWLIDHVLKEDLLMKQALQSLPDDFKP
ncbi:putative Hemerythrin domain-containing protein [Rubrivivax sp. A210]|uniref:bacteriohemerythrin n=1 Tax=Rubrivivax sp. A210 TaxID=2772301 RepID=UPI0019183106|nr:hemerythrin family protein [Rubrivivax sp. A210]CAD5366426.1 putative Hemerythrin domain-containing protein [Rubrivivax sp. A210]